LRYKIITIKKLRFDYRIRLIEIVRNSALIIFDNILLLHENRRVKFKFLIVNLTLHDAVSILFDILLLISDITILNYNYSPKRFVRTGPLREATHAPQPNIITPLLHFTERA